MAELLTLADTFSEWRTKINTLVSTIDEVNVAFDEITDVVNSVTSASPFSYTDVSGLSVSILGGRVRNGSVVETINNATLQLTSSTVNVVAISKVEEEPATIQVYGVSEVPRDSTIPLFAFTTGDTSVTLVADLRTPFIMASGGDASTTSGVLMFNRLIEDDLIIPPERNGLSVQPTVADGVTVTVSDGSVWVVL